MVRAVPCFVFRDCQLLKPPGESIRVLVLVLELVLADGVPSDHALMSSRMSETVIVSDLRREVDSGLWGAEGATGEGRVRGEGGAASLLKVRSRSIYAR